MNRHPRMRAKARPRPVPGSMNTTERRYRDHLELRLRLGEIAWYRFEAVKLRLAANTHYTPDFLVQMADGTLECHEVKGRKGDGPYIQEDANVKVKVAADQYPMLRFVVVWESKSGAWMETEK